jgi:hypothetical protein
MPIQTPDSYVGKKYGMFTVLSYSHRDNQYQKYVVAKCDCGRIKTVCLGSLKFGSSQGCGCVRSVEFVRMNVERLTTHGMAKTLEYNTWKGIKRRCNKTTCREYKYYGGRGIKMCKRWLTSFENFISDMGPRPNRRYSVERINNEKGYSPSNCKWATKKEQCANRRSNIYLTYKGKKIMLSDYSKKIGRSQTAVSKYIQCHGVKQAELFYMGNWPGKTKIS